MDLSAGENPLVSLSTLQRLSQGIRDQLERWLRSGDSLSIFVSGKTGGGKSALVNALLGRKVAVEGAEPDPKTSVVSPYENIVNSVRLKVWDSPGLQDGTENEERYLSDIKTNCSDVDLFLFCINVGDTIKFHLDSSEVKALVKLTEALGHSLWEHAVIALTFANRLGQKTSAMRLAKRAKDQTRVKELFCGKIREWEDKLRDMLRQISIDSDIVAQIRIVPTGFRSDPSLPDRPHWLSSFWFSVLHSTRRRAQPALLSMNETRIVENPDSVDEMSRDWHQEDQMIICRDYGSTLGASYGLQEIGSVTGLEVAYLRTLRLKELVLLEQHFIFNIIERMPSPASGGSVGSGGPGGSGGSAVESLTRSMAGTLSILTHGSSPPRSIPGGGRQEGAQSLSPRSECGGDPNS